jgi:hypothetical protein
LSSTRKVYDISSTELSLLGRFFQKIAEKEALDFIFEPVAVFSPDLKDTSVAMLVRPDLSLEIVPTIAIVPAQVRSVWALDSFFQDSAGWMCRVLEFESLREILVARAKEMDTLKPAFIVGEGAKVRIAAAVIADLGFSEIYLVSEHEEELQQNMQVISRNYIGLQFHALMAHELTMQALNASLLINTVDLSQNSPLLNDLSYFNFMSHGGLVFDYNLEGYDNDSLLEEAQRAELRILPREDFACSLASLWMKNAGVELKSSSEELKALWLEVSKIPPSV